MAVALVFSQATYGPPPVDLVFNEDLDLGFDNAIYLIAALPPISASFRVVTAVEASLQLALPALTASFGLSYLSGAPRGPAAATGSRFQGATPSPAYAENRIEQTVKLKTYTELPYESATKADARVLVDMTNSLARMHEPRGVRHQAAGRVGTWPLLFSSQDSRRHRLSRAARFQAARRVNTWPLKERWQDRLRDRRPLQVHHWQPATWFNKGWTAAHQLGADLRRYGAGRFQQAIKPPAGIWVRTPPEPPVWDPCYLPDRHLVFKYPWLDSPDLVFICDLHDDGEPPPGQVIVPVKGVYIVLNTVSLRRVAGDIEIPVLSMQLSIDCDSWTWGFSAAVPGGELANVVPDEDGPVELEATINGSTYRVLAEKIGRARAFNSSVLRVQGRGKSALLASPYSVLRSFTNDEERTAQQLMDDVLTLNGVSIGWTIDWQIDDWLLPAGAFGMGGPYIDGLMAIAGAAGAYLQPHPVSQTLRVLHRYPQAPWDWAGVTPDFELPSAVTVQEGIEWTEKPDYNRVYVSGTSQGILGRITRAGTAGDLLASMVTDPLITAVNAARQRGIAILGDTGRQARVSLRLPVLPETGVITPGKFVRYNDNGNLRLGIVRGTSVDAGFPDVWQSLELETHE